ncbi:MAG: LodA/GoxA family CTQ-dependent oxidase [Pseudonocardia sp.]|uniref:LodA/GoxA family CTQ-dependent oxidase n=1 Tax=Pseudonocardia sp. TaxID=60912 RepID=UPI003D1179AE
MAVVEYRIHPSVGIARMGDSTTTFFVGAEQPVDQFVPTLRRIPGVSDARPNRDWLHDPDGRLAKQAARFRIFAFLYDDYVFWRDDLPKKVWEVTNADYDIAWTVEVANLKSFTGDALDRWKGGSDPGPGIHELPYRPAAQHLSTDVANAFTAPRAFQGPGRVALGSAVLDAAAADLGTLLVIGSSGVAQPIPGEPTDARGLFRAGWEDDSADGRVTATVTPKSGSTQPGADQGAKAARAAWVVINLPDYGWDVEESGSLYDVALNHGTYRTNHDRFCCGKLDFFGATVTVEKHLLPLLKSYVQMPYVSESIQDAPAAHFLDLAAARGNPPFLFPRLREPVDTTKEPGHIRGAMEDDFGPTRGANMPRQISYSLPRLIHGWMGSWAAGTLDDVTRFPPATVTDIDRPELMDMAAMRSMLGGSFLPGLEVGRDAGRWRNWQADWGVRLGHVDVRITAEPGTLTRGLAVPWQADFVACNQDWWPASRPDRTTSIPDDPSTPDDDRVFKTWMSHPGGEINTGDELITHWAGLGFVRKTGGPVYAPDDQYLDDRDDATRL